MRLIRGFIRGQADGLWAELLDALAGVTHGYPGRHGFR